jgi:hypothetical protein
MDTVNYAIPVASTFSVLVPLFFLLQHFKSHSREIRALALYFAVGFLVDVSTWYFYFAPNHTAIYYSHHSYDLFEAVFFCWFLGRVCPYPKARPFFTWAWILLVPCWAMRFLDPDWAAWFKTSVRAFIAFICCFFILRLVEKVADFSRDVTVWILLGIFFYCFSSCLILGLLMTILVKAWYSHNLINITTNLIYSIGFIRAKKEAI